MNIWPIIFTALCRFNYSSTGASTVSSATASSAGASSVASATSSTTENTQNKTEESESSVEVSATKEDTAKNELISEFDLFKQNNPQGTLQEFYVYLANKINEGNNEQEK